ncbi:hypothetical protein WM29_08600 [Burkholderia ubonensis]|nr:hypothetical protein WM29_08600 [Burkholderia ubonensis]
MTRLIQIAPGVLFSFDVLSRELDRQRHSNGKVVGAVTSTPAAAPVHLAVLEHDGNVSAASGEQLSLLLNT